LHLAIGLALSTWDRKGFFGQSGILHGKIYLFESIHQR
jgi:hypothetical protein